MDSNYQLIKGAQEGNLALVQQALVSKIPVDQKDDTQMTPLMYAVQMKTIPHNTAVMASRAVPYASMGYAVYNNQINDNKEKILALLLDNQAQLELKNKDGMTALNIAVSNQNTNAVLQLIKAGANIDATNTNGYTPLMIAAFKGNLSLIKLLIAAHADINAKTIKGFDAISLAASKGHLNVVEELIKHGADTEQVIISYPKYENEIVKALRIRDLFRLIESDNDSAQEYASQIPASATNHNNETAQAVIARMNRLKNSKNYHTFS